MCGRKGGGGEVDTVEQFPSVDSVDIYLFFAVVWFVSLFSALVGSDDSLYEFYPLISFSVRMTIITT